MRRLPKQPASAAAPEDSQKQEPAPISREQLWDFCRIKADAPSWQLILLALYSPLGISLCLLRCVLWFPWIALYLLAHRLGVGRRYMSCTFVLMGFWVSVKGRHHLEASGGSIIVANHISDFDPITIWPACSIAELVLVANDVWKPAVQRTSLVGFPVTCVWTRAGGAKKAIIQQLASIETSSKWLLMFPEGATTNGRGLLHFFEFVFSLKRPVLPLAISYCNPWPVAIDYAGSNLWHNILVAFFLPIVSYTYEFMPEEVPSHNANATRFSLHVQDVLAHKLDVPTTTFTPDDKSELKQLHRRSAGS